MAFETIPLNSLRICYDGDDFHLSEYIIMALNIVAILLISEISFKSIYKLCKSPEINKKIKYLYYQSVFASYLFLISNILIPIGCHDKSETVAHGHELPMLLSFLSYWMLLSNLLATLIYRLHMTFAESIYKIKNKTKYKLIIVYIFVILVQLSSLLLFLIVDIYEFQTQKNMFILGVFLALMACFFYIFLAIWSVYIFTQKLLELTKSVTHHSDLERVASGSSDFLLSARQTNLINNLSKFVSLFCIASIGSVGTMFVALLSTTIPYAISILIIFSTIDCVLNVICLSLQYRFNNKIYLKYCKCTVFLVRFWQTSFYHETNKSMKRRSRIDDRKLTRELYQQIELQERTHELNQASDEYIKEQEIANFVDITLNVIKVEESGGDVGDGGNGNVTGSKHKQRNLQTTVSFDTSEYDPHSILSESVRKETSVVPLKSVTETSIDQRKQNSMDIAKRRFGANVMEVLTGDGDNGEIDHDTDSDDGSAREVPYKKEKDMSVKEFGDIETNAVQMDSNDSDKEYDGQELYIAPMGDDMDDMRFEIENPFQTIMDLMNNLQNNMDIIGNDVQMIKVCWNDKNKSRYVE